MDELPSFQGALEGDRLSPVKELLERARQEAEEAGVDLSGAEAATQQQTGHAMAGVKAAQKYEAQPFASQLGEATAPQQAGASGQ